MTQSISLVALLREVADRWVAADGDGKATLSRLGRQVVNDTGFFARLEQPGASTTTATLERFAAFLLVPANWPDGRVPQEARELGHRCGVSLSVAALSAGKAQENSSGVVQ